MILGTVMMRNPHSSSGYLLLFSVLALAINQVLSLPNFGFNYQSITGDNDQNNIFNNEGYGDDNDDEQNDVIDNDIQKIGPLQFYAESDDTDDKASVLPIKKPIGQLTGLGINSQGHLVAFHRANRVWNQWSFDKNNKFNVSLGPIKNSTIYVIDPNSGRIVREFGRGIFYMPHGLTVDSKDNIWLTDVGSHQVFKYDKNFKLLMKLGEHLKPGSDRKHFCKPTDVAVDHNGHFFVADGYCNNRIMKFDGKGNLLAEFGHSNAFGEAIDRSRFSVPHSIALIEDLNLICVADRENERIQCFSSGIADDERSLPTGILITKAEDVGRIYAIREKRHYLVGVTESGAEGIEPQLFIMDMNNGRASTYIRGIKNAHCLAISNNGIIYIGQTGPKQIIQISLADDQSDE